MSPLYVLTYIVVRRKEGSLNLSSAMWVEAIINVFARETGRDHDRINVLCLKPKSFPYLAFLLIVQLVFKNRTLVRNKNSFLGRNLHGGVHKQRKFLLSQACAPCKNRFVKLTKKSVPVMNLIANQKTQRQTEAKAVTIVKPQGRCEHSVTN